MSNEMNEMTNEEKNAKNHFVKHNGSFDTHSVMINRNGHNFYVSPFNGGYKKAGTVTFPLYEDDCGTKFILIREVIGLKHVLSTTEKIVYITSQTNQECTMNVVYEPFDEGKRIGTVDVSGEQFVLSEDATGEYFYMGPFGRFSAPPYAGKIFIAKDHEGIKLDEPSVIKIPSKITI